jgi:uncharacterized protein (UPF0218 family)
MLLVLRAVKTIALTTAVGDMQTGVRRRCRARPDADIVDGQTYNELGGGDIMAET